MKKQKNQLQSINRKKLKTELEKKLSEIKRLYEVTPDYIDDSTKELMIKYNL